MAELIGLDLTKHLDCIFTEFNSKESIYGYPKRKMYLGFPGLDFGVDFHGLRAETPLGPASGPHSQMAQNIILAFLGGSRIIELKTVQILDQLDIPRPCIDIRNVGYNVEWSQELRLQDSYNEYITAWILLKIIEESEILGINKGSPFYDTIFDISVGYDLKGIQSPQMHKWLSDFKNAQPAINELLEHLPSKYEKYKKVKVNPHVSDSVTLSTFHGCPAGEIESMVEYLITRHGFNVIVKMNPTILGYKTVDNILHDKLGYDKIELDVKAFDHDISFQEAVSMMKRLQSFAADHDKNVGAKFTNTLVVKNNKEIFKDDDVMYLSGAPLHVLAMHGMHLFRKEMGQAFPISFSAGITKHNFVDAVLCNIVPVTTCTDLLREGGYTRLFQYLSRLKNAFEENKCNTLEDFLISQNKGSTVATSGFSYTQDYVESITSNPLYHQEKNKKSPPKINSHLKLFDCITCDKCLPVCPNASNFSINTDLQELPLLKISVIDGKLEAKTDGVFRLSKKSQIANLADFCNECGDCDTYCPEYGGPYIEKPRFFSSEKSYNIFSGHDGFYFPTSDSIRGRINGEEYTLLFDTKRTRYSWESRDIRLYFEANNDFSGGEIIHSGSAISEINIEPYYIMRVLFDGLKNSAAEYASVILGVDN